MPATNYYGGFIYEKNRCCYACWNYGCQLLFLC